MRRIRDALPAGQLNVAHRQHYCLAAELVHARLERDARPGRWLLKQQPSMRALQERMRHTAVV